MKRSKNYKKIADTVGKTTDLQSYVEAACSNNPYKFDQAVELKIAVSRSNKNPQPYKVAVTYPHQFGQSVKVLVFAEGEEAKAATDAGADYAGLEEFIEKIQNENWFDFDVAVATPSVMPKIARLGKQLGTKGLMPNPKTGTVTTDIVGTVKEFKAGKKNFKEDKSGVINTVVGKTGQGSDNVMANMKTLIGAIKETSPGLLNDIKSIHIKTTMGPSVRVGIGELVNL